MFLIDGSSFCYRAFYAIRELTTSKGQPTNAVYGTVMMLKKLMEEESPEYLGVAFDLKGPTFRHERFPGYKISRPPMPEALVSQIPLIKELLNGFRVPLFEKEGFEADDILATLTQKALQEGLTVYLVTGDKDMFQLLGPRVKVYRPTRDGHEVIDEAQLRQRWGVQPQQVVDVMALMGDAVDAIPGVPGIGEKTAVELVQRFGSVEGLLKGLDTLSGVQRRRSIEEHREQLELSRSLATLDRAVPIAFDLESLKVTAPDREALRRFFSRLEFKKLLKDFAPDSQRRALSLEVFTSPQALAQRLPSIRRAGAVAVVLGLEEAALSWETGKALWVPTEGLREIFEEELLLKICPRLKETLLFLKRKGITPQGPWADPCLASYLLEPTRSSHEVKALSLEFLDEAIEHPDPKRALGLEAQAALRLHPILENQIKEKELGLLLNEVEIPLSEVLARMEFAGIAVDLKEIKQIQEQMCRTLEQLTHEIYAQAGEPFNINSPKQLARILFEKLKLPVVKKTKTGASTDESVLQRLSHLHALPASLLEYRQLNKLNSTYLEALPRLVNPMTGRVHTSFNQTVTATGRLSSSNPNLQNIPIRTVLGRQVRRVFIPSEPGAVFLAADYSQIELRILAHLSSDAALIEAFREGADVHRVTAAQIFHVAQGDVSDDQRAVAKTINFGLIYGMSAFGLAHELRIESSQASEFIERYFAKYPGVRSYLDRSLEETRSRGYCTTLFYRRRDIPELRSKDATLRQFAERMAINAPIQGSAADLIKVAMVAIDRALAKEGLRSRMLLTVHDELVFEVPRGELESMQRLVKQIMEAPTLQGVPIRLSVPIVVNLKVGNHWLEASHA